MINMKVDKKKYINLSLTVRNIFLFFLSKFFLILSCFNSIIISCDNAKFLINISINFPINVEYIVWGIWYKKLNLPLS